MRDEVDIAWLDTRLGLGRQDLRVGLRISRKTFVTSLVWMCELSIVGIDNGVALEAGLLQGVNIAKGIEFCGR